MNVPAALFAVCVAAATLATTQGRAVARGVKTMPLSEHPRLPSEPVLPRDLIYEQGAPPGAATQAATANARSVAAGRALYETHCTSCHGANLRGSPGVPSLEHAGGADVDFYVGTGRMPDALKVGQAVHSAPHFTSAQIDAVDAYVSSRATGFPAVPNVVTSGVLLQHGRVLFEENCQACHGAAAEGATVGDDWVALPLYAATPKQVGEAIRIGPGMMPRFTAAQLSARDVDAIATYVRYLTVVAPSYGGFTMDYAGPAAEGLVGGLLGVGALFWVIYFTGTKADGTRLHE